MTATVTVSAGDGLARIAWDHGFAPATILAHPDNATCQNLHANREMLVEGEVLALPEHEPKSVSVATDRRHVFRAYGIPVEFKVRLLQDDEPRRDLAFTLVIDGARTIAGRTDAQGWLRCTMMPDANVGELFLDGRAEPSHRILFGHLVPVRAPGGIAARLRALGYFDGIHATAASEALGLAVAQFQIDQAMAPSGVADDPTIEALVDTFGS